MRPNGMSRPGPSVHTGVTVTGSVTDVPGVPGVPEGPGSPSGPRARRRTHRGNHRVTTNGARMTRTCFGPGRVNLMGDHTDYNQGLALPMAIDLGVSVTFDERADPWIDLTSDAYPGERSTIPLDITDRTPSRRWEPAWARLAAAVVSLARPDSGGRIHIGATLPRGSGLSSSAALAVALADVFGVSRRRAGDRPAVPGGRAPDRRAGGPDGSAGVRRGHGPGTRYWIDFASLDTRQVPVPHGAAFTVVDSGQRRDLRTVGLRHPGGRVRGGGRGDRAARAGHRRRHPRPAGPAAAAAGPPRRRRVHPGADGSPSAWPTATSSAAGRLMDESHRSLALDFEATTPVVDALVADLRARPGVLGVRMTGAGFGGCVVALGETGALDPSALGTPAWSVVPSDGTVARRDVGMTPTRSAVAGVGASWLCGGGGRSCADPSPAPHHRLPPTRRAASVFEHGEHVRTPVHHAGQSDESADFALAADEHLGRPQRTVGGQDGETLLDVPTEHEAPVFGLLDEVPGHQLVQQRDELVESAFRILERPLRPHPPVGVRITESRALPQCPPSDTPSAPTRSVARTRGRQPLEWPS